MVFARNVVNMRIAARLAHSAVVVERTSRTARGSCART
jgi:hypothetical protein